MRAIIFGAVGLTLFAATATAEPTFHPATDAERAAVHKALSVSQATLKGKFVRYRVDDSRPSDEKPKEHRYEIEQFVGEGTTESGSSFSGRWERKFVRDEVTIYVTGDGAGATVYEQSLTELQLDKALMVSQLQQLDDLSQAFQPLEIATTSGGHIARWSPRPEETVEMTFSEVGWPVRKFVKVTTDLAPTAKRPEADGPWKSRWEWSAESNDSSLPTKFRSTVDYIGASKTVPDSIRTGELLSAEAGTDGEFLARPLKAGSDVEYYQRGIAVTLDKPMTVGGLFDFIKQGGHTTGRSTDPKSR